MTAFKTVITFVFLTIAIPSILSLIACGKGKPEPIEMGHCEVIEYNGVEPSNWICNYAGYSWECDRLIGLGCLTSDEYTCERGQRLSAER